MREARVSPLAEIYVLELSEVMDDCKEASVFENRGSFLGNAHALTRCCAELGRINHGLAWIVVCALLIIPDTKPFLFLFPILNRTLRLHFSRPSGRLTQNSG